MGADSRPQTINPHILATGSEVAQLGAAPPERTKPSTQSQCSQGSWLSCHHLPGLYGTPARRAWPARWTGPLLHSSSGNGWESASGLERKADLVTYNTYTYNSSIQCAASSVRKYHVKEWRLHGQTALHKSHDWFLLREDVVHLLLQTRAEFWRWSHNDHIYVIFINVQTDFTLAPDDEQWRLKKTFWALLDF